MRAAVLPLALTLAGCALESFAVVQPYFRTREVQAAYARAEEAVTTHCGPITEHNPDARVVVGAWQAWPSSDGVTLTQCLVSVLPDDSFSGDVRITFVARVCPLSDLSDLEALATHCEPTSTVRQPVNTALTALAQRLESSIRR
jgi:hypothetical protein